MKPPFPGQSSEFHLNPSRFYHFSEDPTIGRFTPRTAPSSSLRDEVVWEVDAEHADLYYFPRECPRVTFYAWPQASSEDIERFLGFSTARRVSTIESGWLDAMQNTKLYRYDFSADGFELLDTNAGYWVNRGEVVPLSVEPVGDLFTALANAGIETRIMPSLWSLYEAVIASTLGFSIIRWRNATPREAGHDTSISNFPRP